MGGLGASFLLTRLLESYLFGITPTDPWTFAVTIAVFLLVAYLACYLPARRAARLDPMEALRHE
jgi:ABC-type lipoprotein release transport system permease subunit